MRIRSTGLDAIFDRVWTALAVHGHCDSPHGAEYRRVREEWRSMGRPQCPRVVQLIISRMANRPPQDEIGPPAQS